VAKPSRIWPRHGTTRGSLPLLVELTVRHPSEKGAVCKRFERWRVSSVRETFPFRSFAIRAANDYKVRLSERWPSLFLARPDKADQDTTQFLRNIARSDQSVTVRQAAFWRAGSPSSPNADGRPAGV